MRVVGADLAMLMTVLVDPLVQHLLTGVSPSVETIVADAVDSVVTLASPGHILSMKQQLELARAAATNVTSANDRVLLAVLDLFLSFAENRLGI